MLGINVVLLMKVARQGHQVRQLLVSLKEHSSKEARSMASRPMLASSFFLADMAQFRLKETPHHTVIGTITFSNP